jgi:signal transduction histidine kinase
MWAMPIAVTASVVEQLDQDLHKNWVELLIGVTFSVFLPILLGRIAFNRRARLVRDHERAAADAVMQERARIARELHDVGAHAIGVMVVQAGRRARSWTATRPRRKLRSSRWSGRVGMASSRCGD